MNETGNNTWGPNNPCMVSKEKYGAGPMTWYMILGIVALVPLLLLKTGPVNGEIRQLDSYGRIAG
jgi:hypothetical protein